VKVLIANQPAAQCGVYAYGRNSANVLGLATGKKYSFEYTEIASFEELTVKLKEDEYDTLILNYHLCTMPFIDNGSLTTLVHKLPVFLFCHENEVNFDGVYYLTGDQEIVDGKRTFYIGRFLPKPSHSNIGCYFTPDSVGSFGFGFRQKNFEGIIEAARNENFSRANFHIPLNSVVDKEGVQAYSYAIRLKKIWADDSSLLISHDYKSNYELVDWLGGNEINCFFYTKSIGLGISSATDFAIAANRPFAITNTSMFRHIIKLKPELCIENSSLREICQLGGQRDYFEHIWSDENFYLRFEDAIDEVISP
jgi:hypothetical protein